MTKVINVYGTLNEKYNGKHGKKDGLKRDYLDNRIEIHLGPVNVAIVYKPDTFFNRIIGKKAEIRKRPVEKIKVFGTNYDDIRENTGIYDRISDIGTTFGLDIRDKDGCLAFYKEIDVKNYENTLTDVIDKMMSAKEEMERYLKQDAEHI